MRRLLPLVLLAGCRFDTTLPKNLVIQCTGTADCPTEYRCEPTVSLCWSTKSDGVAPQVDFHALTPERAKAGTRLSLTLNASELLSAPPDAVLKSGATQVGAFTVVSAAAPSYAFEYVALGTEPEGDLTVFATLVDVSGTVAPPADLGQVRFDFTPPAIIDAGVTYPAGFLALGRTGPARVSAVLSEPLGQQPQLIDDAGMVDPVYAGESAGAQQFDVKPLNFSATAQVPLQLFAVDLAGNEARLPLPIEISLDTAPPARPSTSVAGAIVYRRAPYGSRRFGKPTFDVTGQPGAVEGPGTVVVRATAFNDLELARGTSDDAGAFGPLTLPNIDLVQVSVQFVDRAGNTSYLALVHDTEWTAALDDDMSPTASNPHQLELEPAALHRWSLPSPHSPTKPESAARPDHDAVIVRAGAYWREHTFASPLLTPAAISAPGLGGVFAFNGPQAYLLTAASDFSDPWWRLVPLTDPELDGSPAAVALLAYDEHTRTIVGLAGTRTWAFQGSSWRLVDVASPSLELTAYDPDRGLIVGFGTGKLYAFDGDRWRLLGGAPVPGSITAIAFAYDRAARRLLLGGKDGDCLSLGALDAGWQREAPFSDSGVPTDFVWSEADQHVVARAIGACDGTTTSAYFDGVQWVDAKGAAPATYSCGSSFYDDRLGHVVQFVSAGGNTAGLATFAGGSTGWALAATQPAMVLPPPTSNHALFELNDLIVHGGGLNGPTASDAGFSVFTGTRWTLTGSLDSLPKSTSFERRHLAGAVPLSKGLAIIGGGLLGPPVSNALTVFVVNVVGPAAGFTEHRYTAPGSARFVYDKGRGRVLARSNTGLDWVSLDPDAGALPSGLSVPSNYAWDERGYVVGYVSPSFTETLGSTDPTWVRDDGGVNELHVSLQDLVTEPVTGHALGVTPDNRVFEYLGRNQGWQELAVVDPLGNGAPLTRSGSPLAPSLKRGTVFMYGGTQTATTYGDLWELTVSGTRPALVFRADVQAAAFPPGTRFDQVEVAATSFGTGGLPDGGVAKIDGTTLEQWTGRRWRAIGQNAAARDGDDAGMTVLLTGTEAHRALQNARDLSVRVVTTGVSGRVPAELGLDAIELTVRATLP